MLTKFSFNIYFEIIYFFAWFYLTPTFYFKNAGVLVVKNPIVECQCELKVFSFVYKIITIKAVKHFSIKIKTLY